MASEPKYIYKVEGISMEYRHAEIKDTVDLGWTEDIFKAVEDARKSIQSKQCCEARVIQHIKPAREQIALGISEDETEAGEVWNGTYVDDHETEGYTCTEYNVDALDVDENQYDEEWYPSKSVAIARADALYGEGGWLNILVFEYRMFYDMNGEFQYTCDAFDHSSVYDIGN